MTTIIGYLLAAIGILAFAAMACARIDEETKEYERENGKGQGRNG